MKKKFLSAAAIAMMLILNACGSSDDDNSATGGKITMNVAGVTKTFTIISVNEENFPDEDGTYTELTIGGLAGTAADGTITISFEEGITGANEIDNIVYKAGGKTYVDNSITSQVQTNNASKLKGTFSGVFMPSGSIDPDITITAGVFDVNR